MTMTPVGPGDVLAGTDPLPSPQAPGTGGRPRVVCLTPVKDEAWILERFLACASLWADDIIVADQGSTDGSREIAAAHPRVHLVDNPRRGYDEQARQRLLIETARERVAGPRLLVALDADEAITANFADSPEWQSALAAAPGTVVTFQWVNLLQDGETCWIPDWEFAWGFMDDGAPHAGSLIHSPRVPEPATAPRLRMREVKVLHYAATDPQRVESRNRWYQCWEAIHTPPLRGTVQYRQYHQPGAVPVHRPVRREWLEGYRRAGIDVTSVRIEGRYRWDALVLAMLREHGASPFRRIDMWDVDRRALAARWGVPPDAVPRDPRGPLDRLVLGYLRRTQGRHVCFPWWLVDHATRLAGW